MALNTSMTRVKPEASWRPSSNRSNPCRKAVKSWIEIASRSRSKISVLIDPR
jgi:hypothetical protein